MLPHTKNNNDVVSLKYCFICSNAVIQIILNSALDQEAASTARRRVTQLTKEGELFPTSDNASGNLKLGFFLKKLYLFCVHRKTLRSLRMFPESIFECTIDTMSLNILCVTLFRINWSFYRARENTATHQTQKLITCQCESPNPEARHKDSSLHRLLSNVSD